MLGLKYLVFFSKSGFDVDVLNEVIGGCGVVYQVARGRGFDVAVVLIERRDQMWCLERGLRGVEWVDGVMLVDGVPRSITFISPATFRPLVEVKFT